MFWWQGERLPVQGKELLEDPEVRQIFGGFKPVRWTFHWPLWPMPSQALAQQAPTRQPPAQRPALVFNSTARAVSATNAIGCALVLGVRSKTNPCTETRVHVPRLTGTAGGASADALAVQSQMVSDAENPSPDRTKQC